MYNIELPGKTYEAENLVKVELKLKHAFLFLCSIVIFFF